MNYRIIELRLPVHVGLQCSVVDLLVRRPHDEERQEQTQPNHDLVRRNRRSAESASKKAENDDDSRKGSRKDEDCRRKTKHGKQCQNLNRVRNIAVTLRLTDPKLD